jgi:hypothetical protein
MVVHHIQTFAGNFSTDLKSPLELWRECCAQAPPPGELNPVHQDPRLPVGGRTACAAGQPVWPPQACRPPTDKILTSLTVSMPVDDQRSICCPHIGSLPDFRRTEICIFGWLFLAQLMKSTCFLCFHMNDLLWFATLLKSSITINKMCFALSDLHIYEFQNRFQVRTQPVPGIPGGIQLDTGSGRVSDSAFANPVSVG